MDDDLATFSGRLKYLRENILGASSHARLAVLLADHLTHGLDAEGLSGSSIQRYESGQRQPKWEFLRLLSDVTGYSIDWIVKGPEGDARAAERALKASAYDRLAAIVHEIDSQEPPGATGFGRTDGEGRTDPEGGGPSE
jgi:transcriptional regulator with XRE-family HTH domain